MTCESRVFRPLERDAKGLKELSVGLCDRSQSSKGFLSVLLFLFGLRIRERRGKELRGRTITGCRKFRKPQGGRVCRHRLLADDTTPLSTLLLLRAQLICKLPPTELLPLNGADGAGLRVIPTELALRIEDWMNVQPKFCLVVQTPLRFGE